MTRIRRAREDEWDRFRDLRLRALEDAPDAFGSTLERERPHGEAEWRRWLTGWDGATTNVVFVAEVRGRWVAVAVGSFAAGEDAHLYAMWVEPESRAAGTGRALVDAVVAWAEDETPAAALDLWVTQGNEPASALYRSAGFEPTGEREVLREGSTLEIVAMRRRLVRP
jgi:ribosomal protein S18 acetylase RimI-like enzyme